MDDNKKMKTEQTAAPKPLQNQKEGEGQGIGSAPADYPVADISWPILRRYFDHQRYFITHHQLHAYNEFVRTGIQDSIRSMNGAQFSVVATDTQTPGQENRKVEIEVYMGGERCTGGFIWIVRLSFSWTM